MGFGQRLALINSQTEIRSDQFAPGAGECCLLFFFAPSQGIVGGRSAARPQSNRWRRTGNGVASRGNGGYEEGIIRKRKTLSGLWSDAAAFFFIIFLKPAKPSPWLGFVPLEEPFTSDCGSLFFVFSNSLNFSIFLHFFGAFVVYECDIRGMCFIIQM